MRSNDGDVPLRAGQDLTSPERVRLKEKPDLAVSDDALARRPRGIVRSGRDFSLHDLISNAPVLSQNWLWRIRVALIHEEERIAVVA
jgi:hypothetical protein